MIIELSWTWGKILYLKTDTDQKCRMLVGAMHRPSGVMFELACGGSTTWHYAFEICEESNILAKITS